MAVLSRCFAFNPAPVSRSCATSPLAPASGPRTAVSPRLKPWCAALYPLLAQAQATLLVPLLLLLPLVVGILRPSIIASGCLPQLTRIWVLLRRVAMAATAVAAITPSWITDGCFGECRRLLPLPVALPTRRTPCLSDFLTERTMMPRS